MERQAGAPWVPTGVSETRWLCLAFLPTCPTTGLPIPSAALLVGKDLPLWDAGDSRWAVASDVGEGGGQGGDFSRPPHKQQDSYHVASVGSRNQRPRILPAPPPHPAPLRASCASSRPLQGPCAVLPPREHGWALGSRHPVSQPTACPPAPEDGARGSREERPPVAQPAPPCPPGRSPMRTAGQTLRPDPRATCGEPPPLPPHPPCWALTAPTGRAEQGRYLCYPGSAGPGTTSPLTHQAGLPRSWA